MGTTNARGVEANGAEVEAIARLAEQRKALIACYDRLRSAAIEYALASVFCQATTTDRSPIMGKGNKVRKREVKKPKQDKKTAKK